MTNLTTIRVFSENLRRLMNERGVTQADLAILMDINPKSLANYYHGHCMPNIDIVLKIADYFNVPVENLFLEDMIMPKQDNEFRLLFDRLSDDDKNTIVRYMKMMLSEK